MTLSVRRDHTAAGIGRRFAKTIFYGASAALIAVSGAAAQTNATFPGGSTNSSDAEFLPDINLTGLGRTIGGDATFTIRDVFGDFSPNNASETFDVFLVRSDGSQVEVISNATPNGQCTGSINATATIAGSVLAPEIADGAITLRIFKSDGVDALTQCNGVSMSYSGGSLSYNPGIDPDPLAVDAMGAITASGTAEPGSTVTVTFPDGSTGTTTAGPNGAYSVTSAPNQPSGPVQASSGNGAPIASQTYTDATAPDAPSADPLSVDGTGAITASGTAEPGSTVNVTFPDGSTGSVVAAPDGSYSITSGPNQPSGPVTTTATDPSGNSSPATTQPYVDALAPDAPSVNSLVVGPAGQVTASGTAEPGALVTITFPDGSTGTTTAAPNGSYSVTSGPNQPSGNVAATATDAAGNTSPASTQPYSDATAPVTPTVTPLVVDATGALTASGTAEPGSTVTVTFPDGTTGTATAAPDGSYSISSGPNQPSGSVDTTATDAAGNTSSAAMQPYVDVIAPDTPSVNPLTVGANGAVTASGTAKPGATVTVTFPDGTMGTTTAAPDGSYSVTSGPNQPSGSVDTVATDAAGNASVAANQPYTDATPPMRLR